MIKRIEINTNEIMLDYFASNKTSPSDVRLIKLRELIYSHNFSLITDNHKGSVWQVSYCNAKECNNISMFIKVSEKFIIVYRLRNNIFEIINHVSYLECQTIFKEYQTKIYSNSI